VTPKWLHLSAKRETGDSQVVALTPPKVMARKLKRLRLAEHEVIVARDRANPTAGDGARTCLRCGEAAVRSYGNMFPLCESCYVLAWRRWSFLLQKRVAKRAPWEQRDFADYKHQMPTRC
jgi:hypothetical protein